jgi:hypothetical protein
VSGKKIQKKILLKVFVYLGQLNSADDPVPSMLPLCPGDPHKVVTEKLGQNFAFCEKNFRSTGMKPTFSYGSYFAYYVIVSIRHIYIPICIQSQAPRVLAKELKGFKETGLFT